MCVQVAPTSSNLSVDELRRLKLNYTPPDNLMMRCTSHIIYELTPLSVYSVAITTRNGFGFSDWSPDSYFETAPGIQRHCSIAPHSVVNEKFES